MNEVIICGFRFKLAGKFFKNPIPSKSKYNWDKRGENGKLIPVHEHITTCLDLLGQINPDKVCETAYLVTVDNMVMYVGEFSKTLRARWLKVDNYIWHNKDDLISDALMAKKIVKFYLLEESELTLSCGLKLNIAKSVEHHILKNVHELKEDACNDQPLKWNQRNKAKRGIKVS